MSNRTVCNSTTITACEQRYCCSKCNLVKLGYIVEKSYVINCNLSDYLY